MPFPFPRLRRREPRPSIGEPVAIMRAAVSAEEALALLKGLPDALAGVAEAATPTPTVRADHLLDLALIMRELWLQDAGFTGDGHRARSMVLAALLRLFPDRAEPSVAECLGRHCPAGRCEDCPADAKTPAAQLDQFLDGLPRPLVNVSIPPEDIDRVILDLRAAKARHRYARQQEAEAVQ